MLHQSLPHVHHDHESLHASVEMDGHNHNHEEGQENHSDSFFHDLINGHAHSDHSADDENLRHLSEQSIKVKLFPLFSFYTPIAFCLEEQWIDTRPLVDRPPGLIASPFLSSHSLRGPPVLG